ncbi:hypothetical protein HUT16_19315 [Kitasatospora sp. NA04385]|uniref:hypothetical protein n=1 Tax=Kitasatospora sp. NA04385 TaxID=2742135 RepID=UPI0015920056|nr:hypothetical protein [Kitasatospora sp. NA04385]QKW20921.1 hypothetical protein HUT16_19315 [Kitasatospora sp. NA04385]
MTHPVEAGARAAARRLATRRTPALATDVEAALHARGAADRPERYFDPVSLGSLIVSVATLAWTVYQDRRKEGRAPRPDVVTRLVRVELDRDGGRDAGLGPAERDRIVRVTVEETLRAAGPEQPPGSEQPPGRE